MKSEKKNFFKSNSQKVEKWFLETGGGGGVSVRWEQKKQGEIGKRGANFWL